MQLPFIEQLNGLQLSPSQDLSRPGALAEIDAAVRTALIYLTVMPLAGRDGRLIKCVKPDFCLEESAAHKGKRRLAESFLERLEHAMSILESIKTMPAAEDSAAEVRRGFVKRLQKDCLCTAAG